MFMSDPKPYQDYYLTHTEFELYHSSTEKRLDKLENITDSLDDSVNEIKLSIVSINSNLAI